MAHRSGEKPGRAQPAGFRVFGYRIHALDVAAAVAAVILLVVIFVR
jgi:hypothetical protein